MGRLAPTLANHQHGPGPKACRTCFTLNHLAETDPDTRDELVKLLDDGADGRTLANALNGLDDITWHIGPDSINRHRRGDCTTKENH